MSIQGQCHLLTLAKGHLHIVFKIQFSQKPLDQSKPNFICAILRKGNQSLYKWSRSNDLKINFSGIGGPISMKLGI